ncbi:MAG: hypothetical protein ACM3NF_06870 [Gemmatimonadota bacterium]
MADAVTGNRPSGAPPEPGSAHRRLAPFGLSLILSMGLAAACAAAADWTVEFRVGIPLGFPSPMTIRQAGQPDLKLRARFRSRPFRSPIYYGWRIGRWEGHRGWEVELVHDKLYLVDGPAEIGAFAISHGFNLLTVNRAWDREGVVVRVGAGAVVAHPENTVRGKELPGDGGLLGRGYDLSGPTVQAALEKRIRARGDFFLPVEGKATASFARVPVADGTADVPYAALHALAGVGIGGHPD